MSKDRFTPYINRLQFPEEEMIKRSESFYREVSLRRTVRDFSAKKVPAVLIENAVKSACTAPSGANMQPWHFVIVSDPEIKKEIRIKAEEEEKEFYEKKAPADWLKALKPFDTNQFKPFLETAPYLIVIFEQKYSADINKKVIKHYYTKESVGIACGILITSLHLSGLATLTHTPSPMNFLNKILNRPANEKPFLILVTGFPAMNCCVPDINRKKFVDVASFK
ncbi:MAG: nitroreductase family protein [Melioribacteraceae bacterium]|nr:nitroreductase family protein [Melioribacteraceae bacterium]